MIPIAIYLALPVVLYLGLVALPPGRGAVVGFSVAAALLAGLWLSYLLSLGPVFTGDGRVDVYGVAAALIASLAVGFAGLKRILRGKSEGTRRIAGWLVALGFVALLAFPAVMLLVN